VFISLKGLQDRLIKNKEKALLSPAKFCDESTLAMNLTSSLFFLLNSLVNSTELSLNETRISAPSIELQLIDSFRVNSPENERFDLSGILVLTPKLKVAFNISGDYLLINDKSSWVYIGTLLTERHEIQTVRWLDLRKY